MSDAANKTILALIPDLFFWSKVAGAASRLGLQARLATSRDALLAGVGDRPRLVIIDLDAQGVDALGAIREIRERCRAGEPRVVAFASHVRAERLASAEEAGCDQVLTRGALASGLPRLLETAPRVRSRPG